MHPTTEWRHRTGRSQRYYDPPLSPYWREYLRRFDRACRERTSEAWAVVHAMAPVTKRVKRTRLKDEFDLLRCLES